MFFQLSFLNSVRKWLADGVDSPETGRRGFLFVLCLFFGCSSSPQTRPPSPIKTPETSAEPTEPIAPKKPTEPIEPTEIPVDSKTDRSFEVFKDIFEIDNSFTEEQKQHIRDGIQILFENRSDIMGHFYSFAERTGSKIPIYRNYDKPVFVDKDENTVKDITCYVLPDLEGLQRAGGDVQAIARDMANVSLATAKDVSGVSGNSGKTVGFITIAPEQTVYFLKEKGDPMNPEDWVNALDKDNFPYAVINELSHAWMSIRGQYQGQGTHQAQMRENLSVEIENVCRRADGMPIRWHNDIAIGFVPTRATLQEHKEQIDKLMIIVNPKITRNPPIYKPEQGTVVPEDRVPDWVKKLGGQLSPANKGRGD